MTKIRFYTFWPVLTLYLLTEICSAVLGSQIRSMQHLLQRIEKYQVNDVTPVEALLRLGQENNVSLGIESIVPELIGPPIQLEWGETTVADVIKRILSPARRLTFYEQDGVVLIGNKQNTEGTWLDFKIKRFQAGDYPRNKQCALHAVKKRNRS